jgi:peptidoglycan/xylan/chitin deacetylase (PgdA/CDA1 family)
MEKLKSKIITSIFDTKIGFNLLKNRFQNTIIMYHGVSTTNSIYNKRHTLKKHFINHILFLKKYCNIISLDDFLSKKFNPKKINVAITFDDGYWNNYSIAKPILEELKIPATFFITGINNMNESYLWADFVDIIAKNNLPNLTIKNELFELTNGQYFNKTRNCTLHHFIKNIDANYDTKQILYQNISDKKINKFFNDSNKEFWKMMSDNEISETSKSKFIAIQSHAYYHNNLGAIDMKSAVKELKNSKKYLENITQKNIDTIGFPDGSYTRELLVECNNIGLSKQLAAEGFLFSEDLYDENISDRKGMYNIGSYQNQLYTALLHY